MHRAPGSDAPVPGCRGQPDIFRPGFPRRVILIPEWGIQQDLHPLDEPVNADGRNQDAGGTAAEPRSPVTLFVQVEPRHSLQCTALLQQPLRQGAAQEAGRRAPEAKCIDLAVRQPAFFGLQVRPVGRRQVQHPQ